VEANRKMQKKCLAGQQFPKLEVEFTWVKKIYRKKMGNQFIFKPDKKNLKKIPR
jgi:hypothetical protein